MTVRQVRHHLGKELHADQKAVQRIAVQIVCPRKHLVEELAVAHQVTLEDCLRERRLVLEMIEEAAFADTGLGEQFVDRRRGEALREYGCFGRFEQPFAGAGFRFCLLHRLYREYSSDLMTGRAAARKATNTLQVHENVAELFPARVHRALSIGTQRAPVLRCATT